MAQSSRTISLVDEIFEINFFANVNIIKALLPAMRERKNGHMIVITGISKMLLCLDLILLITFRSRPSWNAWAWDVLFISMGY